MNRSSWMLVAALGVVVGSLGAGCSKAQDEQAPAAEASNAASSAETASGGPPTEMTVSLVAKLDWGAVQDDVDSSAADVDAHKLVLDVMPSQPVVVKTPKGATLAVAAPDVAKVDALAKDEYTFELLPPTGKPKGFVFKTKQNLDRDGLTVEVKPAAKAGEYEVRFTAGTSGSEEPMMIPGECGPSETVRGAAAPNSSADVRAGFAALSTELEQALPKFEQPAEMMRVVTQAFDRSLLSVDRLRRAVQSQPCGSGSLEFVCPKNQCVIRQLGKDLSMKKGDSLMLGLGTTVEFVSMSE